MTGKTGNNLNERVTMLEVEVKSIKENLKDLEEIKQTSIKQSAQYEYIKVSLDEIKQQVKEISNKPNKYWDTIVTVIITALITGFGSYFLKF